MNFLLFISIITLAIFMACYISYKKTKKSMDIIHALIKE